MPMILVPSSRLVLTSRSALLRTTSVWAARNEQSSFSSSCWFSSSSSSSQNDNDDDDDSRRLQHEIHQANMAYKGRLVIRQTDDHRGWGLFAQCQFEPGQRVMTSKALASSPLRDSHSIQVDWNRHVTVNLPARFVNHACHDAANVGVQPNRLGAYDFVALTNIESEQEILWDYETSEYEMAEPFECACGSPNCRGRLSGFSKHGDQVLEAYGEDFVAPYLLRNNKK